MIRLVDLSNIHMHMLERTHYNSSRSTRWMSLMSHSMCDMIRLLIIHLVDLSNMSAGLIDILDRSMRHDSFICETWLIHLVDLSNIHMHMFERTHWPVNESWGRHTYVYGRLLFYMCVCVCVICIWKAPLLYVCVCVCHTYMECSSMSPGRRTYI